ncbi:hypothetical protein lerEdw1_011173 [Lerista edwardsae]|nr:hypothetical protein lerEdw1_011173 [Lerista edwardsae]
MLNVRVSHSSKDGLPIASPQAYAPLSPFAADLLVSPAPAALPGSHCDPSKDFSSSFSSVDLSFLPDHLGQDDKEEGSPGQRQSPPLGAQDGASFFEGSGPAQQGDEGGTPSLPSATEGGPPMTPMTPMTPASEGSGIVPQLHEEQSRLAARKYARVVQKLGFPAKFLDFKIQNMVGSCDVRFPIRLEGLVLTHQQFSSYEPELFPGLIYRMVKPRIVLLIFVSGKVVLTGAKDRSEIYEAFENIYPILKGFKKAS